MSEREGSLWPFIVPALAAVALVTTVFVVEGAGSKHEALTCPHSVRVTTGRPAVPSVAAPVDKNGHIAPVRLPTDVVVCAYDGSARLPATTALSGSKQLGGRFDSLVGTVAYLPRAASAESRCRAGLGTPGTFLLGMTYTDGTEWIAASENVCLSAPTTNGTYDSSALLAAELRTAYRSGSWPGVDKTKPCATTSLGRSGQESKLVPAGVRSADVCKQHDATQLAHTHLDATDAGRLADTLNALPSSRSPHTTACFSWYSPGPGVRYVLVFHYDVGSDVIVDVETSTDCSSSIGNGSRQATDPAIVARVGELVARH